MQKIGIMGAMALEVRTLVQAMTLEEEKNIGGRIYYCGHLNGKSIVVTTCGVGKVNAASGAQILLSAFGVDALINTGIAGGLAEGVQVGHIVISTDTTHHDVSKKQMLACYPNQASFKADDILVKAAEVACLGGDLKDKYHKGRVVSGECFVDDSGVRAKIIHDFDPLCVEMEGAAIGHVAYLNQKPFVLIRSISDSADEGATDSYEAFEALTCRQSSDLVIQMLRHL